MLIVRGTKKLRDRVKGPPADESDKSTTVLGDWFATALFWKPQVALLVNERTFLPVFMPLAPAATFLDRAPAAIESILRRHDMDETFLTSERDSMSEVRVAPTNNRSVVGVMNELAFQGEIRWTLDALSLDEISVDVARVILGPLHNRSGSPARELASIVGPTEQLADVIPFPRPAALTTESAQASSRHGSVYQLKVTLLDTKPPVWRRLLVDGNSTLDHLHEVVQAAFGWWNYHLHEFEVGRARYGVPSPDDWGLPTRDERRTRLDSIATEGASFEYTYDFGDNWRHKITVEKVLPAGGGTAAPACVGGRRACPPEDCGGTWGYQELLSILADRTHPEHRVRLEWIGGPFDPDQFDLAEFEENLRTIKLTTFDG